MFDAAGRSEESLRQRLAALHAPAWRWALFCAGGDREAAQEILHDAYLAILDGRARHAGRSSFKTFLFGVVRVTARAARRRAGLRRLLFAPLAAAPERAAPPAHAAAAELREAQAAMAALPPRQRAVAVLTLLHDFTLREAAEALGVSEGSARRHYALAKAKLRAALRLEGSDDD